MTPAPPTLRVTHLVATDRRRGAEHVAAILVDALAVEGVAGRLVAAQATTDDHALPVDAHLVTDAVSRWWQLARAARALRHELARHPADVVLAHGTLPALLAALASRADGVPFVWHRILEMTNWPWWHPQRLRLRWIARRAAGVVAITAKTADEVRRLGFHGPIWHVPNHRPGKRFATVDRSTSAAALRRELGVRPGDPLVGFVGHLVQQKQPTEAVQVLRGVRERHPFAQLVVAGDGPRRRGLEMSVRAAGLRGAVHLLGHREDIDAIFAGVDVLIITSERESMPGVAVEAQLAGCPVVAYPVDGIETALAPGRSGIVTRRHDPEEMAAAVAEILDDDTNRQALVTAARAHAAHLSTEHVAARYARLLGVVAGARGRERREPTRVLHVIPDLGVGGAERALEVLAEHLDPDAVTQFVATVGGHRRPLPETVHGALQEQAVGVCDLGVTRRPTRSPVGLALATIRLGRLARGVGADVTDAALLDAVLPARLARGRWARVTHLVNTPYEPVVRRSVGRRRWRVALLARLDRWSARRDDALVAISELVARAARRDLRIRAGDDRLVVIPRGVNLERFAPASDVPDAPRLEQRSDAVTVTAVGRLVPQKGHDTLVRAVARARDDGVVLRLRIAGEGPLARDLVDLVASLGLAGLVDLVAPTPEVAPMLRDTDLFALASRWEGQSNAVLEGMACGLPVVVSDLAVFHDVVGTAGRLVPVDDVDGWADALAQLAADPRERCRLGAAARARVEERYDARERAADLAALYRRVTTDRPRR